MNGIISGIEKTPYAWMSWINTHCHTVTYNGECILPHVHYPEFLVCKYNISMNNMKYKYNKNDLFPYLEEALGPFSPYKILL